MLDQKTIDLQNKLAQYCRDGKEVEIEGSRAENLPHYRRLVFNVMYGIVENAFPIMNSLLSDADFKKLVEVYMTNHNAQVPQVWRVPGEFYNYFRENPPLLLEDYPFLLDLMEMEWVEILVYNREEKNSDPHLQGSINSDSRLAFNPDHEILTLSYPVHKGDWENISTKKGSYYLLIMRNNQDFKVNFLEISVLHNNLIERLKKGSKVDEAISSVLSEFGLTETEGAMENLMNFITSLQEKGFVLGYLIDDK